MHNYGVPTETVRLALVIGIVISTMVYERWHVTSGAVVVAGYLALFVSRPLYLAITMVLGLATFQIVQHLIAPRIFLYGRRRLVVMVLTGMALQLIIGIIGYKLLSSTVLGQSAPWIVGFYGIGFLLPGLIAQDMERQGSKVTLLAVIGTTLLTFLLMWGLESLRTLLPTFLTSYRLEQIIQYSYHTQLLIPAVIVSVLISAILFEWRGIRSGGFVTAAYATLFILQPLHLVFLIIASLLVFIVVTRLLMPHVSIFGRTKFAVMVLTGVIFTWLLEVLVIWLTKGDFTPFAGFSIISPMIVSLIANDGERQGINKTLLGVTICTIAVFIIIKGIDLLFIH